MTDARQRTQPTDDAVAAERSHRTLSGEPVPEIATARGPGLLGPRRTTGPAGGVPVHARGLPLDVPGPLVDHAAVRRVRHARRDQRAVSLPAGAGSGRAQRRLRHAHPDGTGLRRPSQRGRGGAMRCGDRFPRRFRDAVRLDPPGRHQHVDDDQRTGHRGVRVLPGHGGAPRGGVGSARRHAADRHPQGVHRAEGMDLPAASAPAADRRPHGLLCRAVPQVPSGERERLSHPRGRSDGGPGAGVHAGRRVRLRRTRPAPRARRGSLLLGAVVLLQQPHRLLRRDREVPGRSAHLGAVAARSIRRHRSRRDASAVPHADRRGLQHRATTDEQRGADRRRGARRGVRGHAVAAHERAR